MEIKTTLQRCSYGGCINYRLVGSRYCVDHQNEAKPRCTRWRAPSEERGYDWKWRNLSIKKRNENPLCEMCLAKEPRMVSPTELVDHITPIRVDPSLRLSWDNLQSLCRECHDKKTQEDYIKYPEYYSN